MHIYGIELCSGLWNGTCNVHQGVSVQIQL